MRIKTGIRAATNAAKNSQYMDYRVGAALFMGSRFMGHGWNWMKKTSPASNSRFKCIHAELHCLSPFIRKGIDLTNAHLFVVRLTPNNLLAIAKPCKYCQEFLKDLGLRAIYYTNRVGDVEVMTI